jgi:hypothetical protein
MNLRELELNRGVLLRKKEEIHEKITLLQAPENRYNTAAMVEAGALREILKTIDADLLRFEVEKSDLMEALEPARKAFELAETAYIEALKAFPIGEADARELRRTWKERTEEAEELRADVIDAQRALEGLTGRSGAMPKMVESVWQEYGKEFAFFVGRSE